MLSGRLYKAPWAGIEPTHACTVARHLESVVVVGLLHTVLASDAGRDCRPWHCIPMSVSMGRLGIERFGSVSPNRLSRTRDAAAVMAHRTASGRKALEGTAADGFCGREFASVGAMADRCEALVSNRCPFAALDGTERHALACTTCARAPLCCAALANWALGHPVAL